MQSGRPTGMDSGRKCIVPIVVRLSANFSKKETNDLFITSLPKSHLLQYLKLAASLPPKTIRLKANSHRHTTQTGLFYRVWCGGVNWVGPTATQNDAFCVRPRRTRAGVRPRDTLRRWTHELVFTGYLPGAAARAESVTENRNRYRDILKNRNRHRRRYWKNRKKTNTDEKNTEKPKIRFLLMTIY